MKASIVEMEGLLRGKCVPAKMLVNESLAEYLVRQFDALHQRADKAERERDELRAIAEEQSKLAGSNAAKAQKAEEELARRDAAAREPVAFTHESEISNMHATGLYIRGFPADRRLNAEEGYTVALYTAAQPAVLPGEVEELSMLIRRLVHSLKNSNPHSGLLISVTDYMRRKGFWKSTDCMRGDDVKQG